MNVRTRYVMTVPVLDLHEVVEQYNFHKHPDGSVTNDERHTGIWSLRFTDSSAMYLPERPEGIEKGGRVRITIEAA